MSRIGETIESLKQTLVGPSESEQQRQQQQQPQQSQQGQQTELTRTQPQQGEQQQQQSKKQEQQQQSYASATSGSASTEAGDKPGRGTGATFSGETSSKGIDSIAESLFGQKLKDEQCPTKKVSIVGTGQVGSAIAYTLMCQDITHEIALYDIDEDRINGELLDLQQCLPFLCNYKLYGGTDLKLTQNSSVVIITAGERQDPGEDRQQLLDRNSKVFKDIVPDLVKYNPDAVFIVVTNPPDSLAYYTWKLSGLPEGRVIGHGTNLDSCRFRYFLGDNLGVSPHTINAWVFGEHGEKAVPIWSSINVGGTNLRDLNPKLGTKEDTGSGYQLFQQVLKSADKITGFKGYTNWAAGLSVAKVCKAILKNERSIYALSTSTKNWKQKDKYGVNEEVFMSLPCVIGQSGVVAVVNQALTDEEGNNLKECARKLSEIQNKLKV